jgi:uncharacterized integral membrane protein (TIGR00698 family)
MALLFSMYLISEQISKYVGVQVLGFANSPISSVMVALVIGFVLRNAFRLPSFLDKGISFGAKKLLRYGIVLLGLRLSVIQAQEIVVSVIPVIILCVVIGLSLPHIFNKVLHLPSSLVTLISVGTAICGITAIAATSESLSIKEEHTAYAITTITIFGLLGMAIYPFLSHVIFTGNSFMIGLFLGTSIHDTAQVTGAAFLYQDFYYDATVVQVATIVKLIRNTFMVVIIPGLTLLNRRYALSDVENPQRNRDRSFKGLFPIFIIGFVAMMGVRTIGDHFFVMNSASIFTINNTSWNMTINFLLRISSIFITMALASVGLSTSVGVFKNLGFKPILVGLITTMTVGITSCILIFLLF